MYLTFFGFSEAPFDLTPDPRFFFLSRKHREALGFLVHGIEENKGFIAITGVTGSGKTTLYHFLIHELKPDNTRVLVITDSKLTEMELLQKINEDLGIRFNYSSQNDLLKELKDFLIKENNSGNRVILIIDEAQKFTLPALEQIRMLGDLETETHKLIQIILLGQPELLDKLQQTEMVQLNQRISLGYHIKPLDKDEVKEYIFHRLKAAQAQIEIEFTPPALKLIYEYSEGIPKNVNILCNRCLLNAYSQVNYTIDENIVKESIKEIQGETEEPSKTESIPSRRFHLKTKDIYLLVPIVFLVIAAGIYVGLQMANQNGSDSIIQYPQNVSNAKARQLSRKVPDNSPVSGKSPEENKVTPTPTPEGTEPETREESSPAPKRTYYLFNWQYDKDNICRVNNPVFAYTASIISWLRLFNIEVELDEFRNLDPLTIQKLDLIKRDKQGLKKYVIGEDFNRALRYDTPFLLILTSPPEKLSPVILLVRAEGISLTVADSLWGIKSLKKSFLEKYVSQCVMLYFDTLELDKIRVGETSERVKTLQTLLKKEEVFSGVLNGVYDEKTIRSVRNLQEKYRITATGYIDGETALLIALSLSEERPRLYPTTGEK